MHIASLMTVQIVVILCAALGSFLLRFDFAIPHNVRDCVTWGVLTWIVIKLVTLHMFGASRGVWRYCSTPDVIRIVGANAVASAVSAIVLLAYCPVPFPLAVLVIDFLVTTALASGIRIGIRLCYEFSVVRRQSGKVRTLIYGAGQAGVALLQETRKNESFANEICGFIDDNKHKRLLVQGVPVLGNGSDLARLVRERTIDQVLIATPSATAGEEVTS